MRPRLWRTALLNLLAWSIVLAVAFPLIWMVLTSIKPQTELFRIPPSILPQSVTFEHYRQLLEETPFLKYFGNSVLLACSTTVLVVAVGTLGAFSLVRFRYPGRDRMALLVLATYLLPSVVLIIPLYLLTGGGPLTSTLTLPLLVYQQAFGLNRMGMAASYAVVMMVVMLVFMALYLYRARRAEETA